MRKTIQKVILGIYITGMLLLLTVCNSSLDIQQHYSFTITAMPVPKSLTLGETAEIRLKIQRDGYFEDATYSIRYFQTDGEGELKLSDGTILLPNDLYQLSEDHFRIYYTSQSTEQQRIDIYIEDNFGQTEQLSFNFTNRVVRNEE
jgi:hypothetical protein